MIRAVRQFKQLSAAMFAVIGRGLKMRRIMLIGEKDKWVVWCAIALVWFASCAAPIPLGVLYRSVAVAGQNEKILEEVSGRGDEEFLEKVENGRVIRRGSEVGCRAVMQDGSYFGGKGRDHGIIDNEWRKAIKKYPGQNIEIRDAKAVCSDPVEFPESVHPITGEIKPFRLVIIRVITMNVVAVPN